MMPKPRASGKAVKKRIITADRPLKYADITIGLTPQKADIVFSAIQHETDTLPRAKVSVLKVPFGIRLRVEAEDTSALRAAVNSYLRWITVAVDVSSCCDE